MSILKLNPRTALLLIMIVAVAALRIITSFSSDLSAIAVFTPIGAMALFGGAYFQGKWKPFAFPLLALFLSDVFLSFSAFSAFRSGLLYTGWFWTYVAFAGMTIAGKRILKKVTIKNIFLASMVATLIHWLVSDIGACLIIKTGSSLLSVYRQRLITALPYELWFFAGTIIYCGILFGTFEWIRKRHGFLQTIGT